MARQLPDQSDEPRFTVGYKNPPRHTRFQPGRSGNPGGRPKGRASISALVARELDAKVALTENGEPKRYSKRELVAKQLVNAAVKGSVKAITEVRKLEVEHQRQTLPPDLCSSDPLGDEIVAFHMAPLFSMGDPDDDFDMTDLDFPPPDVPYAGNSD